MGESRKDVLRVNFDKKLKLEFHGTKVTSDTGLLAWIQLMLRIAEKLEFITGRVVKVCATAGIERRAEY